MSLLTKIFQYSLLVELLIVGIGKKKVIEDLKDYDIKLMLDNLVILNPRRENFPIEDKSAASQQIYWEFEMIEKCNAFSMYFTEGESDQPIYMYELGRNILRMQTKYPSDWEKRIIVSIEAGYKRKQDAVIQTMLATNDKISINYCQLQTKTCLMIHEEKIVRAFKKLR